MGSVIPSQWISRSMNFGRIVFVERPLLPNVVTLWLCWYSKTT